MARDDPHLHRGVRRLALAACGVALASALAAPAHADTEGPRSDPLSGLPLPERAGGPAHPRHHAVVVRPGDTLWALAEHDLPAPATDRQVSVRWHAVYRRNRGVIGPDPDLIRPGQVLKLTKEKHDRHPDPRPGRLRAGHPRPRPEPTARPSGAARAATSRAVADVVPIDPTHRGRLEQWVHRFVQASVEIVGGDRPASQLLRWTTGPVYADLHRRALLVARAGGHQPGVGRVQPVRPHVVSVHASFVSPTVAEASARVRYGVRSRALALRFEKRRDRWLCTAMEFA